MVSNTSYEKSDERAANGWIHENLEAPTRIVLHGAGDVPELVGGQLAGWPEGRSGSDSGRRAECFVNVAAARGGPAMP